MKRSSHPFGKRLRDADGQSMIEAAIITPLMLLLTIGIIEFGAVFYVFLSLQNGVSQATRYAITGNAAAAVVAGRLDQGGDADQHADPRRFPTAPSRSATCRRAAARSWAASAVRAKSRR